jgi:hypothetical protein
VDGATLAVKSHLGKQSAPDDVVVAVSSDLDLEIVLQRITVSACRLVDATYGAQGRWVRAGESWWSGLVDDPGTGHGDHLHRARL